MAAGSDLPPTIERYRASERERFGKIELTLRASSFSRFVFLPCGLLEVLITSGHGLFTFFGAQYHGPVLCQLADTGDWDAASLTTNGSKATTVGARNSKEQFVVVTAGDRGMEWVQTLQAKPLAGARVDRYG